MKLTRLKQEKLRWWNFSFLLAKKNLRKSFQSKDLAGLRDLFTSRMSATQIATKNRNI